MTIDPLTTMVVDTESPMNPAEFPGGEGGAAATTSAPGRHTPASDPMPFVATNSGCGRHCEWFDCVMPKIRSENLDLLWSFEAPGSYKTASSLGPPRQDGALMVVGLGIRSPGQLTPEVQSAITSADRVFYSTDDGSPQDSSAFEAQIRSLNPASESIDDTEEGSAREQFDRHAETILAAARGGSKVCFVTYGNPGICYGLSHELIRRAGAGVDPLAALMLPAVSSLDSLFVDMALDPATQGVQVFDTSEFVLRRRKLDRTVPLVLLQPSLLGLNARKALVKRLKTAYSMAHTCYLYRAAPSIQDRPIAEPRTIASLSAEDKPIEPGRTLLVPATERSKVLWDLKKEFDL
jgi:precorrin-6B methylase 1